MPKELTPGESRVALAPHAVHELARAGHRVLVEAGAGEASSIPDQRYEEAGARVTAEAGRVYEDSRLVVKVYGPVEEEYGYLREGLILFSFLSLQVERGLMQALLDSRCVAFAMETVRDRRGGLPVLAPMSEIAGRLTPQVGAHYLQRPSGGRGPRRSWPQPPRSAHRGCSTPPRRRPRRAPCARRGRARARRAARAPPGSRPTPSPLAPRSSRAFPPQGERHGRDGRVEE